MRTTITLDADVAAFVQRAMRERGRSFKETVNDLLRKAAKTSEGITRSTPVVAMGEPTIPLDHALRLAADLEDAELRQKLSTGR
jgi:hypothetical protein